MKVIFLDIDGVLVTLRSFKQFKKSGSAAQADPDCVAQLNRLLHETGVSIVLSSTWRMFGRKHMDRKFEEWGIHGPIIDFTPFLEASKGAIVLSVPRGREIQAWLNNNPGVERFTILDDESDMEHMKPYLIQTRFEDGLTAERADRAIEMLQAVAAKGH